jgi:hypothetical protein
MAIVGAENLSDAEIQGELQRGARLVVFEYCISIVVMTFKRSTDVHLIRPGQSAVMKGLPWTLLSLLLGWWGFPWGVIYTPAALMRNLSGGRDVTDLVLAQIAARPAPAPIPPAPRPL